MRDPAISTAFLGVLGVLLAVAAVGLLRLGRWPRRMGGAPHCKACGYSLEGNESGRCPECGRELTPQNTVAGARQRRPGLEAGGWLAGAAAVLLLAKGAEQQARSIDWYRYRPAGWVVKDAASPDVNKAQRAWEELTRRGDGLPDDVEQSLIQAALLEQSKPRESVGPLQQEKLHFLFGQYLAGRLTPAQAERFLHQVVRLELRVRPRVALGDEVPYFVSSWGSGPALGSQPGPDWSYSIEHLGVWIDGKRVEGPGGSSSGVLSFGGGQGSRAPVGATGKHTVEARARVEIYHGPLGDRSQSNLRHRREVTLAAPFEVDDRPAAEHVRWIERPELLPAMQAAIRANRFGYSNAGSSPDPYFEAQVTVSNVPENIAFEVFARAGNVESPIGTIALAKGQSSGFGLNGRALKDVPADQVDLIFRASDKAARGTVDLYQIWKGEVAIPGVKIQRKAKTKPTTKPQVPAAAEPSSFP